MATQSQIDANRRNAQKSTGPTTPEGRAAVRHNSLKNGLTGEILIVLENLAPAAELTQSEPSKPVPQPQPQPSENQHPKSNIQHPSNP